MAIVAGLCCDGCTVGDAPVSSSAPASPPCDSSSVVPAHGSSWLSSSRQQRQVVLQSMQRLFKEIP